MKFLVETQGKQLQLSAEQLVEHLSGRIFSKQREDVPQIALAIIDKMRSQMEKLNIRDIVALSMQFGYYYRVFLEKNKVEVVDERNASEAPGEPNDEVGSG